MADLTALGASGSQQFFDDGTHGDATPGDTRLFVPGAGGRGGDDRREIPDGALDGRAGARPGCAGHRDGYRARRCGVEYWNVKTGNRRGPRCRLIFEQRDSDADHGSARDSDSVLRPSPGDRAGDGEHGDSHRSDEFTVFKIYATSDAVQTGDGRGLSHGSSGRHGNTIVSEVPSPACVGAASPFLLSSRA